MKIIKITFNLIGREFKKLTTGGEMRSIGTLAGSVAPVATDTTKPISNVVKHPMAEYHKYDILNNQNTSLWLSL